MAHIKQLTCMDPVEVDFARLIETRSEQRGATFWCSPLMGCGSAERRFMFEKRLTKYISCHIQGRQARREC